MGIRMVDTKKSKAKEIILGILSVLLLFSVGQLLSGEITLAETIEFHDAHFLAFVFPFIAAAVLIWSAKYSAKNNKATYYKTVIICFLIPFAARLLAGLISAFASGSAVAFVLYMLGVTNVSVTHAMFSVLDKTSLSEIAETFIILAADFIPMIAGLVASFVIYRKNTVSTDG